MAPQLLRPRTAGLNPGCPSPLTASIQQFNMEMNNNGNRTFKNLSPNTGICGRDTRLMGISRTIRVYQEQNSE
uniref:Uncharacterized protein n=1 Tax=viral metagenome TaxID=1070528 RepID=A0A6M3XCF3_9ZZZZ